MSGRRPDGEPDLPRPIEPPPAPPGRVETASRAAPRRNAPPGDVEPPAPVVTEAGEYGQLPALYEDDPELYGGGEGDLRRSLTWTAAVALAVVGALWALAFTAERATSPSIALPFHERSIEALTGLEGLLLIHEDRIRDTAEGAAPPETIDVPGYPVQGIGLAASEVHGEERDTWHALLLARSAEAAYQDGLAIFHEDGAPEIGGIFTTSGAIARIVNTLSADRHAQASRAAELLGYGALALIAATVLVGRGVQRFVAVGGALVAAAGLVALGGLLAMAAVAFLTPGNSALADEFTSMANELARMPLRAALYLGAGGILILLPAAIVGYVLSRLGRTRALDDEATREPSSA